MFRKRGKKWRKNRFRGNCEPSVSEGFVAQLVLITQRLRVDPSMTIFVCAANVWDDNNRNDLKLPLCTLYKITNIIWFGSSTCIEIKHQVFDIFHEIISVFIFLADLFPPSHSYMCTRALRAFGEGCNRCKNICIQFRAVLASFCMWNIEICPPALLSSNLGIWLFDPPTFFMARPPSRVPWASD
jgi:hypothetical protein